jgi:hypothetical protein
MSAQAKQMTRGWATSMQRVERPAASPVRGHHHAAATERGTRTILKPLPKGFADRLREQHVLRAPGVAEGFDRVNALIEDWEKSL